MSRTRLTAGERRAQLVEVARTVFAKRGYEATTIEEIADRAKVSKPIVYEHFGGKEGLYAVIVDREMEYVVRRISEAIGSGEMEYVVRRISEAIGSGSPRDRVEQAALAFLTYVKDHPDGFAILAHDSPLSAKTGMASLLNDVAERVGEVFAASLKAAGYDPRSAPIYAHALIGMVTFVGRWWTEARKPSVEDTAAHIAALAWMGLRHLPKHPTRRRG